MDNILFGDPFYHNIIYYLSWKDLYTLKCVCKHFRNNISKKQIKKTTIKNIREKLHMVLGSGYEKFMKKYKSLSDSDMTLKTVDELSKDYNKYFIVQIFYIGPAYNYNVHRAYNTSFTIKTSMINIQNQQLRFQKGFGDVFIFTRISNDTTPSNIKCIKNQALKSNDPQYATYWL